MSLSTALAHVLPMSEAPDGLVNAITSDGSRVVRVERLDRHFVGPDRDYADDELFGWLRPTPELEARQARADYHAEEYDLDRSLGRGA